MSSKVHQVCTRSYLNCLSFNAQGIKSKIEHLAFELCNCPNLPDVVYICETWCNESILFTIKPYDEYDIFRCDRNVHGGGTFLMVLKKFKPKECCSNNNYNTESTWCECKIGKDSYILGCIYRPPVRDFEYLHNLTTCINVICDKYPNHKMLLYGDFNLPSISWNHETPYSVNNFDVEFIQCIMDNNLHQLVTKPTRENNILDLVFVRDNDDSVQVSIIPQLIASDHECLHILCEYNICLPDNERPPNPYVYKYDFVKGEYDMFNTYLLSINWFYLFSNCTNIFEKWNCFYKTINDAIDLFIPKRKHLITGNKTKKFVPKYIRKLINKKLYYWRLFKHTNNTFYKEKFKSICKIIACESRANKLWQVQNLISLNSRKKFFDMANNYMGRKTSRLIHINNEDSSDYLSDKDCCDKFGEYFSSVFKTNHEHLPEFQTRNGTLISDVIFTCEDIIKVVHNMNNTMSHGPDNFSCFLVKKLISSIASPLSLLFQCSMHEGKLPEIWKIACITPIYKGKGSKHDVANFRPISLTSVICKIMESIIKDRIMQHCIDNNLISSTQHGFLRGKSTVTNLLELTNVISTERDQGNNVDIICIDFAKAFDTVPHTQLIYKLSKYGIAGDLLQWIKDYILLRKMFVKINSSTSQMYNITSSVPQGSVLAPLFFMLFMNDINAAILNSKILLYADDVTLLRVVNNANDNTLLQDDLSALCNWAKTWLLDINLTKCKVIHFGCTNFNYYINNTLLSVSQCEKILGVCIDNDLSFKTHIFAIVKKARQTCNLMLNAFAGVDIHVLVSLYKIYVRSVLDYASIVYSPHFLYLIDLIENVQRNFTKRLSGLSNMSYAERLIVCNLEPLELRRIRTDMLFVYKLLNGIIKCNLIEYVKISDNMHNTRGNSKKLEKPYAKLLIRNNHFVVRCVNNWNSLTNDIVCAKSYNLFRKYVYMFNNFTLRGHAFNVS